MQLHTPIQTLIQIMNELVVGVIFPAKKIDRLKNVLQEAKDNVRFVLMDLSDASLRSPSDFIAKYGRWDAILHKLAHEMVFASLGNDESLQRMTLIKELVTQYPEITIIDPIESVQLLTNRHDACEMLCRLQKNHPTLFNVPSFAVVRNAPEFQALCHAIDTSALSLPLICKSIEACGTDQSHLMSVITKRSDLQYPSYPAIYQEFINHSGRLLKGYVLGDLVNVAERKSLPNLTSEAVHVTFNTQETYPSASDFQSTVVAANTRPTDEALIQQVKAIGDCIRSELKLSLFGFDVIVSEDTHECLVIDVNYFPSYKELEDFDQVLRRHIRQTCQRKRAE